MKLIKPFYEILPQSPGLDEVYKQIEVAGRTCYKSEDKITPDSAKGFVERMIASGHGAMLEHGTVYLTIYPHDAITGYKYRSNKYSKYFERRIREEPTPEVTKHITTNYRVLVENNWLDDLEYAYEPTVFHEKRVTVRFICDRGVTHEYVRHRVFSFAQESTRFCNYSQDKFGKELTFIIPCWSNFSEGQYSFANVTDWENKNKSLTQRDLEYLNHLKSSEITYFDLLKVWDDTLNNNIWTSQQARSVLPNSLKTELVMTGFVSDWKHFFELRDAEAAHPQARELAKPLHEEFIKNKWL